VTSLVNWYRSLPRAMRWLVWFGVGLAVYFLGVERVVDVLAALHARGDQHLAVLERYEGAAEAIRRSGDIALLGVRQNGNVEMPGDPVSRPLEFDRAVAEVLKKHGISGETITTRTTPLNGNYPLVKKAQRDNMRVDRLTKTLEFQAPPEVVVKVLADLEQNPKVTTISNVQMRAVESRGAPTTSVSASITIETWIMSRKGRTP
jgi:hypothetical protein